LVYLNRLRHRPLGVVIELRQLQEWTRLATRLPPGDARIQMRDEHARDEPPAGLHPLTREVLEQLRTHDAVVDVVDHCTFPDYQVLRTLHTLAERGIVSITRVSGATDRAAFVQRRRYSSPPPELGANPSSSEVLRASRYEPGEKFALVESGWKYIHRTAGGDELFDLSADPYETRNLVAEAPDRAEAMKARLLERVAALAAGATREASPPDSETLELLETLGYVP